MGTSKQEFHILLVGCGNIGARHLQAAVRIPEINTIEILDLNPKAVQLGQTRLEEVKDRNHSIAYRWLNSLDQATPDGDLCMVMTQASGRSRLVMEIFKKLNYKKFFLEKIVDQSILNYEALLGFCKENGILAWVNCKGRTYPFHQRFKAKVDSNRPIFLSVVSGNHGLANSGIHVADLFFFYDGSKTLTSVRSCIDPVLHPTKRNQYDLSGMMIAISDKGSCLNLCYQKDHVNPPFYTIGTQGHRFIFDHPHQDEKERFGFQSDEASGWQWEKVSLAGNLQISHMSTKLISEMLQEGRCGLPTLEECYPAHKFILTELNPHFNELLAENLNYCPVT